MAPTVPQACRSAMQAQSRWGGRDSRGAAGSAIEMDEVLTNRSHTFPLSFLRSLPLDESAAGQAESLGAWARGQPLVPGPRRRARGPRGPELAEEEV